MKVSKMLLLMSLTKQLTCCTSKHWIMLAYLMAFTTSYKAFNVWMIVGDKLEKTQKKAVVAFFKVLQQHVNQGTGKKDENFN